MSLLSIDRGLHIVQLELRALVNCQVLYALRTPYSCLHVACHGNMFIDCRLLYSLHYFCLHVPWFCVSRYVSSTVRCCTRSIIFIC